MAGKRLEKPNKRRLPLRAWLLYLAVATFALTGVTFSRYVASAHSQDEGRVITFGDLTVTDSGSVQVQPGVAAQKDLTVHFDGSEAAVYVLRRYRAAGRWARITAPIPTEPAACPGGWPTAGRICRTMSTIGSWRPTRRWMPGLSTVARWTYRRI